MKFKFLFTFIFISNLVLLSQDKQYEIIKKIFDLDVFIPSEKYILYDMDQYDKYFNVDTLINDKILISSSIETVFSIMENGYYNIVKVSKIKKKYVFTIHYYFGLKTRDFYQFFFDNKGVFIKLIKLDK